MHVVRASIACWKPWQSLWEFSSRWKPSTASGVFTDLLSNSPKCSPQFSPGFEGTENMFYFLNRKVHNFKRTTPKTFFNLNNKSPVVQQFSRCWPGGKHLIWTHPRNLDLANESTHWSGKRTSYITMCFTQCS